MEATYNLKKPIKRKIPKMRVPPTHHWVMDFPSDFKYEKGNPIGKVIPEFK